MPTCQTSSPLENQICYFPMAWSPLYHMESTDMDWVCFEYFRDQDHNCYQGQSVTEETLALVLLLCPCVLGTGQAVQSSSLHGWSGSLCTRSVTTDLPLQVCRHLGFHLEQLPGGFCMASLIPALWCQLLGSRGAPVLVAQRCRGAAQEGQKRSSSTALTSVLGEFAPWRTGF